MAIGMKGWLGITAVGLLMVVGWGLAPVQELPEPQTLLPERAEFIRLNRELSLEAWKYQTFFRRDTLVEALNAALATGESIFIKLPPEAADSTVETVQRTLERQMDDWGLDEPAMPVGLALLDGQAGAYPGPTVPPSILAWNDEVYLARDGEDPYCLVATPIQVRREDRRYSREDYIARFLRYRARVSSDLRQPVNLFGFCRFFARHGSPGSPILAWLKSGANSFGHLVLRPNQSPVRSLGPIRGPFGKAEVTWGATGIRTQLCLAGEGTMCEALVLDPGGRPIVSNSIVYSRDLLSDSPVDFIPGFPNVRSEMLSQQGYFFSHLQHEFGPDRFGAFWRSDLPISEAFEAAFGQPLDLWVMGWLRRYADPPARGPGVPVQATFFTLLAVGIMAGGAVRMGRR